jgi:Uma2 family endonuclease
MIMKTPASLGEDQVVHLRVSWEAYVALASSLADDRNRARLTYDGVSLEIMSPGRKHELIANLLSAMLNAVTLEWEVPLTNVGSVTFESERRGFEADKGYYLGPAIWARDAANIDLTIEPPPDLLVEIDITNRSSDKLELSAELSVRELWWYRNDQLLAFALVDGTFGTIDVSSVIAGLPIAEVAARLESGLAKTDIVAFTKSWHQWLRDNRHLHHVGA